MDAEIVTQDYFRVEVDDRLSDARSIFDRDNPKAIVVTEDGDYAGVLTQKRLLGSHVEDRTKVSAVAESAPRIDRHDDVREVARMLVEGGTKAAPVFDGEKLVGVVTADAVLESVLDSLDALSVADIYTTDVVTVTEEDDIGAFSTVSGSTASPGSRSSTTTAISPGSSPPTTSWTSSPGAWIGPPAGTARGRTSACSIYPPTTS